MSKALFKLLNKTMVDYHCCVIDAGEAAHQVPESAAWVLGGTPDDHTINSARVQVAGISKDLDQFLYFLETKNLQENLPKNI